MNGSDLNTGMDEVMAYEMVYPEIYYRVQPFVIGVCDQMEAYGGEMPSSEAIASIADTIYTDVMAMYPDLAEYVGGAEVQPTITPFYRRRFRRRGIFRDFVEILLLNEIFRRL
ncbi:MAG: hypothetical protein WC977_05045 [Anaerovoracaceae bacterium]